MHTLADLALARRHVKAGRRLVTDQRDLIARLVAKNLPSINAENLLKQLLETLAFMEWHWEEIEASIDRSGAVGFSK